MTAAGARELTASAIRRAMDEARSCTSPGDCEHCDGAAAIAMGQADIYAGWVASDAIDKAIAPYRLAQATAEHSPKGGRPA